MLNESIKTSKAKGSHLNFQPFLQDSFKKVESSDVTPLLCLKEKVTQSQGLYRKAEEMIPGGTQLFSKKADRYAPDIWPAYFQKAQGCRLWDLDGNEYLDMGLMGVGSCILGYADADVNAAVKNAIDQGSMSTLNCPEEVELAQKLCEIHPWAKMARFARTGGEGMSIAVRVARAKTQKDLILFCGYHGWHDWYLAANLNDEVALSGHLLSGLEPDGVPQGLKGTAIPFSYNDMEGFLKLIDQYKDRVAAVVMEPIRNFYPKEGFLETIREVTLRLGIILIFDEITSGWRLTLGGAHLKFGVNPDMAVFAKGMSNGYAMAAVIGTKEVMTAAEKTFISSTYWTERIGPVAALATIKKLQEKNVVDHLDRVGAKVMTGWQELGRKHGVSLTTSGTNPLGHFAFESDQPLVLKTLFIQEMLRRGFLTTTAFYASYAHTDEYVQLYLKAVDEVFAILSKAIREGKPEECLEGPVCEAGFRRLA